MLHFAEANGKINDQPIGRFVKVQKDRKDGYRKASCSKQSMDNGRIDWRLKLKNSLMKWKVYTNYLVIPIYHK